MLRLIARRFADIVSDTVPTKLADTADKIVRVTFVNRDGSRVTAAGLEGQSLLDVARAHNVDLEGRNDPTIAAYQPRACDGSCACSTCHVILTQDVFSSLPPATDEEDDMLDLAFGLTDTSRLGCQVKLSKQMDGMIAALPKATRNIAVDGHIPKPH